MADDFDQGGRQTADRAANDAAHAGEAEDVRPMRVDAVVEERLIVDVDGFEGPLDLLLELARRQKIDLHRISILALAEQYLAFVEEARRVRLELAADYLVMAAWLAYLKSRLLLPQAKREDEPEAGDLAAALADRLRRLEIIRLAAGMLEMRPRLGRELHVRGAPDEVHVAEGAPVWTAAMFDLLAAYTRQRQKQVLSRVTLRKRTVWSLVEAREALQRLAGTILDWTVLDDFLLAYCTTPAMRRTVRASAFSVTLEMVKEGTVLVRQDQAFAPIWIRSREPAAVAAAPGQGRHARAVR